MSDILKKKSQAAEIRDAYTDRENTALRVGTMFIDLIDAADAELEKKITGGSVVQIGGDSTTDVMSQKAVTDRFAQANEAISSEASMRQQADAYEASARQNADSIESTARQNADAVLQGNIDAEAEARQNAIGEMDLADIDLDGFDKSAFARRGKGAAFYKVTSSGRTIGTLQMFSDDAAHQITQVLTTNCTLYAGAFGGSHTDNAIHVYRRNYGDAASTIASGNASWSAWEQSPEFKAMTDAAYEALAEKDDNTIYLIYDD